MEVRTLTNQRATEIDSKEQTGQAKAVLMQRRSPNKLGKNQFTFEKSLTPYSMKYALAETLLKQGKTITATATMTGLCRNTVMKVKNGEIKLANEWVSALKGHESAKHTFLSNLILDSINSRDLEKASLLQKVTSSSILIDKRRLLDGESTANVNHLASLDNLSNMAQEIAQTMSKFEALEVPQIEAQNAPESHQNGAENKP